MWLGTTVLGLNQHCDKTCVHPIIHFKSKHWNQQKHNCDAKLFNVAQCTYYVSACLLFSQSKNPLDEQLWFYTDSRGICTSIPVISPPYPSVFCPIWSTVFPSLLIIEILDCGAWNWGPCFCHWTWNGLRPTNLEWFETNRLGMVWDRPTWNGLRPTDLEWFETDRLGMVWDRPTWNGLRPTDLEWFETDRLGMVLRPTDLEWFETDRLGMVWDRPTWNGLRPTDLVVNGEFIMIKQDLYIIHDAATLYFLVVR